VAAKSEENKMPISNLALLIAPNIIRNKDPGTHLLEEIKLSNLVFEMILENHEFLFQNVKRQFVAELSVSVDNKVSSALPVSSPPSSPTTHSIPSPNYYSSSPGQINTSSESSSGKSGATESVDNLGSSSNPKIRRRKSESRVKRDSTHKRISSSGRWFWFWFLLVC
jgi:hypothetical protein